MDLGRLHIWLVDAFVDTELRRVVTLGPDGERIAADLPTAGTLTDLAYETARAWKRHAVDRRVLLDHLLAYRPNRRAELVELLGAAEVIEPVLARSDGVHVALDLSPAPPVLNPDETRHLCEHLRRLAEETAPAANVDIRVVELVEWIGCVKVAVEVAVWGNFEDEMVAETQLNKFHDRPWAMPSAMTVSFDHDDQRVIFVAHAVVSARHLSS